MVLTYATATETLPQGSFSSTHSRTYLLNSIRIVRKFRRFRIIMSLDRPCSRHESKSMITSIPFAWSMILLGPMSLCGRIIRQDARHHRSCERYRTKTMDVLDAFLNLIKRGFHMRSGEKTLLHSFRTHDRDIMNKAPFAISEFCGRKDERY